MLSVNHAAKSTALIMRLEDAKRATARGAASRERFTEEVELVMPDILRLPLAEKTWALSALVKLLLR